MKIRNGIFAGVLPAMLLTGCMGGLPSCGSSEAEGLVKKIVNQKSFFIGQFVSSVRILLIPSGGRTKKTMNISWK